MKVALVQFNIASKDKKANFDRVSDLLGDTRADLIILPEMFNTAFEVEDLTLAEPLEGESIAFIKKLSLSHKAAVCASLMIDDQGVVFNRFVLVAEGELVGHYDKAHLFGMGGEAENLVPGSTKVDMVVQGFKIRPIICYDLRFPYSSFNDSDYDILLNVANWPSGRIGHWDTLLQARAIENQAFVIGCNRVGEQLQGDTTYFYPGHSSVYTPGGERLAHSIKEEVIFCEIDKQKIEETRNKLPFLKDRRM
jgi:predicted amidohydrolase